MATDSPIPFCDLMLSRRLEASEGGASFGLVAARAQEDPQGSATKRIAGAFVMYDGTDSPMTQTFGLGMFEPATAEVLGEIEGFYDGHGAATHHEVSPHAGLKLSAELVKRGYAPVEFTSVMFRPISVDTRLGGEENAGLTVRSIGAEDVEVWARTAARGWSEHGDFGELLVGIARVNATRSETRDYLVEKDGEAIAAGSMWMGDGVLMLAGASTVPEARRKGAQLALLGHRLRAGAEHGCELAMMCAEPGSASQRNAERHGFRIAYTRTKWRRPARA